MYETLIWEETFPGCSLNEHNWNRRVGNWQLSSDGQPVVPGWGNQEQQYYTANNLEVSDGTLKIIARQEEAPEQFGIRCPYTSARIDTHGKFSFQYGRVVFRARCPIGNGLWPAVWMLPEDSVYGPWAASGEIDIFEAKGRLPQSVFGTIHFGGVCPQNTHTENQAQLPNGQRIDQFHIYELIWEPDSISWLIDGVPYAKVNQWDSIDQSIKYPAPFDQPFYLLVNLAIGGSFDLESAQNITPQFPAIFEIDYIRVYQ